MALPGNTGRIFEFWQWFGANANLAALRIVKLRNADWFLGANTYFLAKICSFLTILKKAFVVASTPVYLLNTGHYTL
jgi:hypothetical protein